MKKRNLKNDNANPEVFEMIASILDRFGYNAELKEREDEMRKPCAYWNEEAVNQYAFGYVNGYLKAVEEIKAAFGILKK